MYDKPGPEPAPDEVCLRAWELYGPGRGWRQVAAILTEEGHKCSHEGARQWGFRGRKLYMRKKDLSLVLNAYRAIDGLEQLMGALIAAADDPDSKVTILDVADHAKWIYRERARTIADAQPPGSVPATGTVEPPAWIQEAIAKSGPSPEEEFFG